MDSPRNGKPTMRWGRKVMDLYLQTARLPKGFSFGSFYLKTIEAFWERSSDNQQKQCKRNDNPNIVTQPLFQFVRRVK